MLCVLGLTLCVATAVFLVALEEDLRVELDLIAGGDSTLGFPRIFSRLTSFVIVVNLLFGALAVLFLFSQAMSERVRDIGIMKAFGCLTDSVFRIFIIQLSIIVGSGCIIGTAVGLLAYAGFANIFLHSSHNINWWLILIVLLLFFFLSHFAAARPVAKAIQLKPADALSPSHMYSTTTEFGGKSLSRLGLTFKVAFRSLLRRALPTRSIFFCLTILFTLIAISLAGGLVASETTASYVERAIERNTVLIAHKELVEQYRNLLLQFQEKTIPKALDYLDERYAMSEAFVEQLTSISSVEKYEKRLLFETTAREGYGLATNPIDSSRYYFVGEGRAAKTFIMGIEPADTLSNWLIHGRPLTDSEEDLALIGTTVAEKMFTKPLNQTIIIFNISYRVSGICIDPFNNGNVTYVSIDSLSPSIRELGFNLVFLQTRPEKQSQLLTELDDLLARSDFECLALDGVLDQNLSFLRSIWSLIMVLPLTSLFTAALCLSSYLLLLVARQQREFGIMRALGAKLRRVTAIVMVQILIILSTSSLIGVSIGFLTVYLFLIPDPIISAATLQFVTATLTLVIVSLTLYCLFYSRAITGKSIRGALRSF